MGLLSQQGERAHECTRLSRTLSHGKVTVCEGLACETRESSLPERSKRERKGEALA